MFLFIVRRLLIAIPILILSSVLVFVLVVNAGDPLEGLRSRPNSQQLVEQKIAAYHLDQPVVQRYLTWAKGVLHGDFGKDATGQEVRPKLHARPLDHHAAGHRRGVDRGGAGHHRGGDQRHTPVHLVRLLGRRSSPSCSSPCRCSGSPSCSRSSAPSS